MRILKSRFDFTEFDVDVSSGCSDHSTLSSLRHVASLSPHPQPRAFRFSLVSAEVASDFPPPAEE